MRMFRNLDFPRFRSRARARRLALAAVPLTVIALGSAAHAQLTGIASKPLPNVLLLIDTSGSMERMPDNSLPSENRDGVTGAVIASGTLNACSPGVQSNPNRWGMLVQALTGNMQPFFSCDAIARINNNQFKNEYKLNSVIPYDDDYILPYHRPLSGPAGDVCAYAPYKLPGATTGSGVGPSARGAGGDARDFPADAFTSVRYSHLQTQYGSAAGAAIDPTGTNACTFSQAPDGQLDATRDFIRFAMMTFDNDPSAAIGVDTAAPPSGTVLANPFAGQWSYFKGGTVTKGLPGGCLTPPQDFEVGARHWAAPPWEGRMVPFARPDASLLDLARTNDQIQQVLIGTRPYGATPIDGMMADAADYMVDSTYGPHGTVAGYQDPYATNGCRDQYILLLTDGAPNQDMRPSCELTGGICPYPNRAAQIAHDLSNPSNAAKKVNTFVIGFSVNGSGNTSFTNDGFPAALDTQAKRNCKNWYSVSGGTPAGMLAACSAPNPIPPTGSTADACCKLNAIAYEGTSDHSVGPFFAETQADLVLSFGRILGGVAKVASTRTLPGYSPVSVFNGKSTTAEFVASFIPSAQKVWSGEIDRTRSTCNGATPTTETQDNAKGDSYATNTANQATAGTRYFISVMGEAQTVGGNTVVDSSRTMRPYTLSTSAYTDGIPDFFGSEDRIPVAPTFPGDFDKALGINATTCKRSKDILGNVIPALTDPLKCAEVVWGFATARTGTIDASGTGYDYNTRCKGAGGLAEGTCSISVDGLGAPKVCTMGGAACPIPGEQCVPKCAALGAIYRSSPTLVGAPTSFLRDEGYRTFAQARANRRPLMYVASTDGVLHAFQALEDGKEVWAFVPPAVLPSLKSNYPGGQQILLDGTAVVKDTVWDRRTSEGADPNEWKSTLVAGMGAAGPGYYALNVTDGDCGGTGDCANATVGYQKASNFTTAAALRGPHFLWQMTDIPAAADLSVEPAKRSRKALDGTQMVALFGKETGTPAITTLQVNPDDQGVRQLGVAILPGGLDGPPIDGESCGRATQGGPALDTFTGDDLDASKDGDYKARASVRRWSSCAAPVGGDQCKCPVPGRGVTIVRLDTGEIIRHFGRTSQDVPFRIRDKTILAPFDSPIIGTPAVYPNAVGATAQRIFVGDADGTVWRIDVSSPDPAKWTVSLFQDLFSTNLPGTPTFADSQPIQLPMALTQDPGGNIILNAATGDQENLVPSKSSNVVFSIKENRPTVAGKPGVSSVNWFLQLDDNVNGLNPSDRRGERVTGPMVVLDRTLYFATFRPFYPTAGSCGTAGAPTLWGMDYLTADPAGTGIGGAPRWCPIGSVKPETGACEVAYSKIETPGASGASSTLDPLIGQIVPGVTIRQTQACSDTSSNPDDPAITGMTPSRFELFFGYSTTRGVNGSLGTQTAGRSPIVRPTPRSVANIDAWAYVLD